MDSKENPIALEVPSSALKEYPDYTSREDSAEDASLASSDDRDMLRLGRKQELKRRFQFLPIVGFATVLGLTWEFSLVLGVFSLSNGGPAGAIWLTLAVCFGMSTVIFSMAEMASMAPTAGGQYHWVSEFAPRSMQKFLSYLVGWFTFIGWQTSGPAIGFICGQLALSIVSICKPDFEIQGWQEALFTIAFVLLAAVLNTVLIRKLSILEIFSAVLHIAGFFVFIAVIWAFGDTASASETFTDFRNGNGWSSIGLAVLVSIVNPANTYLGGDSIVHVSEEVRQASYIIPRAMIIAAHINFVMGFVATVTLMFNLGSIQADLNDPTGQPWVAIVYRTTGSKAGTIVLVVVLMMLFFFCLVNWMTTASRQLYAFARDKGVPFHRYMSRVEISSRLPLYSILFTVVFACLLALIQIGSTAAFNIVLSSGGAGIFTSYICCIGSLLSKRIRGEEFPASKFRLSSVGGYLVNIIALCFCFVALVFLFFPAVPDPDPADMNWAILIYGSLAIFAMVYYWVRGRHQYDGPVSYVRWQAKHDMSD